MNSPVSGAFLILIGLFVIFGKDLRWGVESFRDNLAGKNVERTELWDLWQNVGGIILIVLGVYLLADGSPDRLIELARRTLSF